MSAFLYGVLLQWKIDFRDKGILLTYYVVPLVFFAVMGSIFSSISPAAKETLIQSMCVFGVTMGALLGAPSPLTDLYGSEIRKAFKVGNIPLWVPAVANYLSGFVHLLIMSLIIMVLAPIAFGAKLPDNLTVFLVGLALFIGASLAVGTLLGLMVKSSSKLTMVSQFVFLPSILLSGIMFPAEMLPRALQYTGRILPATSGFQLMTASELAGTPLVVLLLVSALRLKRIGKE